ncbi:NACHT, LRR and PYD domains-containing protein 3-like [Sardina pilchardus]|uniref:NACHT, LRR and PYD domains-containing protein 3-like n=1 Tax=Sardina pilchardus TaxID=27697 RepID=UPI002E126798
MSLCDKEDHGSTPQSSTQRKRSHSPVPSCGSMKSDKSMDPPLSFGGGVNVVPPGYHSTKQKRSHSPVPSCVSMKSDKSMDPPLFFGGGGVNVVPPGYQVRSAPEEGGAASNTSLSEEQHTSHGATRVRSAPEEGGAASNTSLSEEQHTSHGATRYQQIHKSHLQKKFQCLIEGIPQQGDTRLLLEIYTDLYITEGGRGEVNYEHEVRQIERASWREAARGSDLFGQVCNDSDEESHDSNVESHDSNEESNDSDEESHDSDEESHDSDEESHDSDEESHDSDGWVNDEHEVRQIERASWREAARGSDLFGQVCNDSDEESHDSNVESHDSNEESNDSDEESHDSDEESHDSDEESHDSDEESHDSDGWVNDEHEVRQIERASWREAAQGRPIKCSDIFERLLEEERHRKKRFLEEERCRKNEAKKKGTVFEPRQYKPLRTVLTKGVAGIGKTVSVQKFILDWIEGTANQDVHFIFLLPFRELNLMKEKKLSLVGLLQHFFPEIKDPKVVSSSEHRVMFIFDGLDECRLPLDFHSNPTCCDVTEPASVDVLLTNLIKGNLLPSALLWITTRPAAANQIPPECVHQVTEIRGFNDPQKEEYFKKKIIDENLASRTIIHLKSSRSLYIMCHIPVFCWISATVVEKTSKESDKVEMPRTLTQMYTHFLVIQTGITNVKYTERKETDEEVISKLGKLAFQQLEKGNLIFYEEDLRGCGIDVTEASVYSGVCTQIFREEAGLYQGKVFSFVHLSIQEFLAALYVFLCFSNRQRNKPDQQQTSQLSALFTATTCHGLHKTAVDLALQSKNGHLDLFLRFLLGLSLESNQNLLKHLLPQNSSQSYSSEQTVQYVKQKIRDQRSSDRRINLFYCLNELNHHAVVEHKMGSEELHVETLLPGQWETKIWKRFKMSEEQLAEFDLQKYIKTPEEDQTELLSPEEVLQKVLPGVTSAMLHSCNLSDKSCSYLASALKTSHSSNLRVLNLSDNKLLDSGVELLCSALCHHNCKLEELRLCNCNLSDKSCSYLASALKTSHSSNLRVLHLSNNKLLDSGVELLCSALCHHNCKLEELQLCNCNLSDKSCSYLASALKTSHSSNLRVLDLGFNKLLDSGVELLCSALCHHNCKLEELQLWSCDLSDKSCSYLASALKTSHSSNLRVLNLSDNKLLDSGVELLCSALCHHNCKLEVLRLKWCDLSDKSCSYLASALKSPSSNLTQLSLIGNYQMSASAVEPLCALVKDPHCKLEYLQTDLGTVKFK